jgi:hypothetical protein
MARRRGRDRGDSGMGVVVQPRKTPLRLRGYPSGRMRERLANGPGSHYNHSGSQSIVASNEPGSAHLAVLADPRGRVVRCCSTDVETELRAARRARRRGHDMNYGSSASCP